MRSLRVLSAFLAAGLAGTVSAGSRPELPSRFVPALDGAPVSIELGDGERRISAWAYRSGAEYDIAVSTQELGGAWTPPQFLGSGSRLDEVEPALAIDASGNVYVAFSVRPLGAIHLAVRPAGAVRFSEPVALVDPDLRASAPALSVVGNRLATAFRSGRRTALVDVPLYGPAIRGLGIQDGPAGVDPLGATPPPPPPPTDENPPFGEGKKE